MRKILIFLGLLFVMLSNIYAQKGTIKYFV